MGLDMYLTKKTYVFANYEFEQIRGEITLTKPVRDDKGNVIERKPIPIKLNRVTYIAENVMYWRKANQIHKWFVDNVQEGVDDCGEYAVSIEQLQDLLDLCIEVKENISKAPELLPTQEGCFFGNQEYGKCYKEDIEDTIKGLSKIIDEDKQDNSNCMVSYYYSSSW